MIADPDYRSYRTVTNHDSRDPLAKHAACVPVGIQSNCILWLARLIVSRGYLGKESYGLIHENSNKT